MRHVRRSKGCSTAICGIETGAKMFLPGDFKNGKLHDDFACFACIRIMNATANARYESEPGMSAFGQVGQPRLDEQEDSDARSVEIWERHQVKGATYASLAREYGVSAMTIGRRLSRARDMGLEPARDLEHEDRIRGLLGEKERGATVAMLVAREGVSRSTIYRWMEDARWLIGQDGK